METIKSSAEITRLFKEGRRVNAPELSLIVLRTEGQHDRQGRVAFIAGKKLGNAVWRNKARRRMREACRQVGAPIEGYDIAFVARSGLNAADFQDIVRQMKKNLARAGVKYE